jgi:hypothetical protein
MNTVKEFKDWWYENNCPIQPPFCNSVFTTDIAYSLVLFRKDNYQVELYTCKPSTQAPFHSHPGVDSLFVYLTGNIEFGLPDETFTNTQYYQRAKKDGTHMLLGKESEAMDGAKHTLRVGDTGGAFLSFEKWDREPHSVTINWKGESVGQEHEQTLKDKNG